MHVDQLTLTVILLFDRKQRKRSDGSKPSGDNLGSNKMIELFPPTSPRDRHSDQESVTTAEPQSEPEDFDDHRSESIVSSVGVHEADGTEHDTRSVPTLEVTTPSDADDRTSKGTCTYFYCGFLNTVEPHYYTVVYAWAVKSWL